MSWDVLEFTPTGKIVDRTSASLKDGQVDDCKNVDFWAGLARSLSELDSLTVPLGAPYVLQYYGDQQTRRWAYAHATGVAEWNGLTHASIKPAAGLTNSTLWDADYFGSWLVITNDKAGEAPHAKLAGSALLAPIPAWGAGWDCKFIRTHRNVLFAADLTESGILYPNRLRWSSSAVAGGLPQEWTVTPSNDAGMVDLEMGGGAIIGLVAVGDSIWIAGSSGVWVGRWQGGAYTYTFSQRTNNYGARGYRCIVSLGDAVAVLSVGDLVLMDEQSERSLMIGRNSLLLRRMGAAQLLYVEVTRQLYVLYEAAEGAGYTEAEIWDRDSDSWGHRSFKTPFTAFGKGLTMSGADARTWANTGMTWADAVGAWQLISARSQAYVAANAAMVAGPGAKAWDWMIQRQSMPAPDGDNVRALAFEADIDGPIGQTVSIRTGSSKYPGESPTWGPLRPYMLGAGAVRHDDIHKGRYIGYRIEGNGDARVTSCRWYYTVNRAKP